MDADKDNAGNTSGESTPSRTPRTRDGLEWSVYLRKNIRKAKEQLGEEAFASQVAPFIEEELGE